MKQGVDAKVKIKISGQWVLVSGLATWTYSGEVRETLEALEFGVEYRQKEPSIYTGGTIECTGFYKLDTDTGQQFLEDCFRSKVKIYQEEIRFYLDATHYLTLDASTTPPSYLLFTKSADIKQDVAGVGTLAFSATVSGRMKRMDE